ncbi:MAG: ATP-binding protein [Verrucomicrobiota bacterium]
MRDKLTTFTVTHSSVSDRIRAVITDDAPAYDPLAGGKVDTSIPLEDRAIGGLGVHLAKKLMNVSLYERIDGKKILTIDRPV